MINAEETAYGGILYRKADGICTITLNRPERLNAIDHGPGSLQRDLTDAVMRANADPDIRCIVVTGAGRAFTAGGYIRGPLPVEPVEWWEWLREQNEENERLRDIDKPVIGAINGMCYGFGLILASNFDFLIAVDTAQFCLMEVRFGDPAAEALAYLVGPQWAKFLAITGENITAQKAKEIGLVMEVFPQETFMPKVMDLARRIAAIPPFAVTMQRRIVNSAMENMGWKNQKNVGTALNALLGANHGSHRHVSGRLFSEIHADSWDAFKKARDEPFTPPWLDNDIAAGKTVKRSDTAAAPARAKKKS